MSKTKDVVIDQQNKQNEENEKQQRAMQRVKDVNRLSMETASQLCSAISNAMEEIQGERETKDAIMDSELFCDMWSLQAFTMSRELKVLRKESAYIRMKLHELLKELYQRMQMFHHYGACHSRPLPGIAWTEDKDGRFVINLRECAVNMEHSIPDEKGDNTQTGKLFSIAFDPDIDCESGELEGRYEEALSFFAEFKDEDGNIETRDVYPNRVWRYDSMLCDTIAQFDVISDMANEEIAKP